MQKVRQSSINSAASPPPSYIETLTPSSTISSTLTPRRTSAGKYASMTTCRGDLYAGLGMTCYDIDYLLLNRLHLTGFPESTVDLLRVVITSKWQGGIQAEKLYHGTYEFKLKGMPFHPSHADQMVKDQRLMCYLFQALAKTGWIMISTADVTQNPHGNCMLFKHQPQDPEADPEKLEMMCITFNDGNTIRIIDTSERLDKDTVEDVVDVLGDFIVTEQRNRRNQSYEMKLEGHPLHFCAKDSIKFRELLLRMLGVLEDRGWMLHANLGEAIYCCRRIAL